RPGAGGRAALADGQVVDVGAGRDRAVAIGGAALVVGPAGDGGDDDLLVGPLLDGAHRIDEVGDLDQLARVAGRALGERGGEGADGGRGAIAQVADLRATKAGGGPGPH